MKPAYEITILEIARHLRDSLREVDDLDSFSFSIEMSGRVHEGEIKIEMNLRHPYKYNRDVVGAANIEAMVDEFKRRHGWSNRHAPLCLSATPQIESSVKADMNDELPF